MKRYVPIFFYICTNSLDHTQTHLENRKEKDVVPSLMRHIYQMTRFTRRYNLKQFQERAQP